MLIHWAIWKSIRFERQEGERSILAHRQDAFVCRRRDVPGVCDIFWGIGQKFRARASHGEDGFAFFEPREQRTLDEQVLYRFA